MSTSSHICWVDLESTGTNPHDQHAAVLEAGVIVTRHDPELTEVARASMLIRPPGLQSQHDLIWARMDPFVQDMHRANGLWAEATTSTDAWDNVEADVELGRWLAGVVRRDGGELPVPLAGSGVAHLDSPFIKAHLPAFAQHLTYWMIDIGNVRRMLQLAGRPDHVDLVGDVEAKPHRGLADVEMHVSEARRYLKLLGELPAA